MYSIEQFTGERYIVFDQNDLDKLPTTAECVIIDHGLYDQSKLLSSIHLRYLTIVNYNACTIQLPVNLIYFRCDEGQLRAKYIPTSLQYLKVKELICSKLDEPNLHHVLHADIGLPMKMIQTITLKNHAFLYVKVNGVVHIPTSAIEKKQIIKIYVRVKMTRSNVNKPFRKLTFYENDNVASFLKYLSFGPHFDFIDYAQIRSIKAPHLICQQLVWPSQLKRLTIKHGSLSDLPDTLTHLTIEDSLELNHDWPSSLTYLKIHTFTTLQATLTLPASLKMLHIQHCDVPLILPFQCEQLSLPNYNLTLQLVPSLKVLKMNAFNQVLTHLPNLLYCEMNAFNHELKYIPGLCKYLSLNSYTHPINVFPMHLKHLELQSYTHPISMNVVIRLEFMHVATPLSQIMFVIPENPVCEYVRLIPSTLKVFKTG